MKNSVRRAEWSLAFLVLFFAGLSVYAIHKYTSMPIQAITPSATTSAAVLLPQVRATGNVTLALGETAKFENISITPELITEDSRCAKGNTCIWAGTVRVSVEVTTASSSILRNIGLKESATTTTSKITLLAVDPFPVARQQIASSAYRFTFNVIPYIKPAPPTFVKTPVCYVGGCSKEVCSEDPYQVSSCIYKNEFACYKTATCERQPTGQCGWTETPALQMCITNASSSDSNIQ
jgi:hypothetical protein